MWSAIKKWFRGKSASSSRGGPPPEVVGGDLIEQLQHLFRDAQDVKFRDVRLGDEEVEGSVVFIDGLVDERRVEQTLLWPLLRWAESAASDDLKTVQQDVQTLAARVFTVIEAERIDKVEEAAEALLQGDVVFAFHGRMEGLEITNRGWQGRQVEAPNLEVTIRGPQDGFTENILWNTALLRRRIRDPNLRIEMMKIGRRSRTDVAFVYIDGVASPRLVKQVRERLDGIDIDGVLDTGYLEHLIEDEWWSPFPHHLKTERPDRTAAGLLEGRVAVFADTTPFVLIMPATFDSMFHSPEDSYDRWFPVSLLRVIRFVAAVLSVTMPGLYVALVAYHPGILPTEFLLHVMASREGVAFPVVMETLLMQFFLELIKEAGFRMPSPIGQTFGIVGGLILGEIGVRAGIVSEAMVIVVAITAVSSFAAVDRELGTVLRLLGLPIMLAASLLGLYGLVLAGLAVLVHLVVLRSYGVPFVMPYTYYHWTDAKDWLLKAPLHTFHRRPSYLHPRDVQRMAPRSRNGGSDKASDAPVDEGGSGGDGKNFSADDDRGKGP